MTPDASFHSGISAKTAAVRVRHSLAISGNIDLPFLTIALLNIAHKKLFNRPQKGPEASSKEAFPGLPRMDVFR
jgi:hypothetical protein